MDCIVVLSRHPYTTASIWSSGKITCTGANSEEQARVSARKFSRILQNMYLKLISSDIFENLALTLHQSIHM